MIAIKTRSKTHYLNTDLDEFMQELENRSQAFIKINGEVVKKTEIIGANNTENKNKVDDLYPVSNYTQEQRNENLYVYEYMKSRLMSVKKHNKRIPTKDEIRAVIAEARVSYNDDVI
jgi:hypothetical protein